ncbi:hypothetical protein ABZ942_15945 [Nocardia sp. NPDC046473]|uniref:hypothetical protein n=1 Tax=Nocardia sp. NPDC046473 TaxID=3155733 RepID=UPI0033E02190
MTSTPITYSRWTRRPLNYLPVHRQGQLIGYLWASTDHYAAGFERQLATAGDDLDCLLAWERRLDDAAARGLAPIAALEEWIGAPEDAVAGAVPPGDPARRRTDPGRTVGPAQPGRTASR